MATLTDDERKELEAYLSNEVLASSMLEAWIKGAMLRVGRCYFGQVYIYALSLMVMHKAELEKMASEGVVGPVTSKREGDLSIGYGSGSSSGNNDLDNTIYGKEYLELLEQYSPRPGVTGGVCCGGLDGGDIVQSLV